MTIVARHALSPSTPRACGATLRASGVDCSARPSKEGYHAMNADTCLVLLTPDQFGQEKARKISLRRKISLTWGASYKPPARPGDTYRPLWRDRKVFAWRLLLAAAALLGAWCVFNLIILSFPGGLLATFSRRPSDTGIRIGGSGKALTICSVLSIGLAGSDGLLPIIRCKLATKALCASNPRRAAASPNENHGFNIT